MMVDTVEVAAAVVVVIVLALLCSAVVSLVSIHACINNTT